MRLQGLEPWTPWLRVRCSTNWAKGASYEIVCRIISNALPIIAEPFEKCKRKFYIFFIFLKFPFFCSKSVIFPTFSFCAYLLIFYPSLLPTFSTAAAAHWRFCEDNPTGQLSALISSEMPFYHRLTYIYYNLCYSWPQVNHVLST